ncbi:MAG: HAMP domain-containing sensor histidine kinase [Oscillospiraceae bacterium]
MAVRKSITKRWIINSLSIILVIIIAIAIAFSIAMKNFYYTSVRQVIDARANVISGILVRMSQDETVNFTAELRKIIENSDDKNIMEIAAINHSGIICLSSSGFQYQQKSAMPDYEDAIASEDGIGSYIGKSDMGERIMAVSVLIPYINSEYSAIRYCVALTNIDGQISTYILLFALVAIIILIFTAFSGFYFIRSIVIPVRDITAAALKFARGDMNTRIEKKSDDEIGQLCDVINYMAEEMQNTERLKNEFISSVSHELRTPLTAIKGWSETLMTVNDTEMNKKGMRVITGETERLSNMVEELLDFSRIQNGRLVLLKSKMDVLAELGEAVLIYGERAKRDKIDLIYNEPEYVSFINGDKNRLRQVFINIIDNALKYSNPDGTVTITVEEKDGFIIIKVSDTGLGISAEDLPKIKTKFYKANHTRRGSGIGLAVADEIITQHNGTLTLESELNVGTTVIIRLPIYKS